MSGSHAFACRDAQTRRMIRRAPLKAVAAPGTPLHGHAQLPAVPVLQVQGAGPGACAPGGATPTRPAASGGHG